MASPKRCIFLTGAPRVGVLSWDETALLSDFQDPARRFLGTPIHPPEPSPTGAFAKWRSVPYDVTNSRRSSLLDTDTYSESGLRRRLDVQEDPYDHEFLEHSIAILEDLDATQIVGTAAEGEDDAITAIQRTGISFATTSFTDTSTEATDASFATTLPDLTNDAPSTLKIPNSIDDLKHLPKADHIERIRPQTKTVNLLVGIINISETRTVHLRRSNRSMDIIEMTVGDDTRAGFRITFWLAPETGQKFTDNLRPTLKKLRSGHVALIQNVALTSWNGNVYGQSLSSKRFAGNGTAISVIESDSRPIVSTPVALKLQRVRSWVDDFVGCGEPGGRSMGVEDIGEKGKKRKLDELVLPPDTQD